MKIETTGHVHPDGSLDLHLETGLQESEVRIMVYIEPKVSETFETPTDKGWPPGFFEELYGCTADDPLVEPDELPFENREAIP